MMKILVMDIGATAIKSAIIDDNNELSDVRVAQSSKDDINFRSERAIEVARGYKEFDVVSVATTGQVDNLTRSIAFQYRISDTDVDSAYPIGDILECGIKRPVFVLNDCNAAALGEAYFGAGRKYKDFLCLTYGTGVGGAIIRDHKIYTGHSGVAGEMGHMVTHKGGRLCGCGNRGCYEQYASTTALVRSAKKLYPSIENAKNIFDIPQQDPALKRVIRSWEDEIVAGLLTLTYIFNPSCMVLGGGVMEQKSVLEQVRRRFYKSVIPTFSGVDILSAELGNNAGMFGAALYARQSFGEIK